MDIVGVRYELSGPVRYCDPGNHELEVGDRVLVQTESGEREAEVVVAPDQVLYAAPLETTGTVLRKVQVG